MCSMLEPEPTFHAPSGQRPRPLRVRVFTDTLADVNGVSRFILDMLRLARDHGHDLGAVTSTRRSLPPTTRRIANLAPLWARPMPGYANLDLALPPPGAVRRQLLIDPPDVVHISTPGPVGFAAWRAARSLGIPVVATYHTDFPAYVDHLFGDAALTCCARRAMRAFYSRCDLVLTRSAAYARVVKDLGVHCSRIHALRPGTNTATFNPQHRDAAVWERPGASADRAAVVRVLYVGRVSVEKNLPLLAAAWRAATARLAASVNAELVVVGDGPYLPAMRAALAGTPTRFLGFKSGADLSRLYASSDLFVFPSATDTLGQGVLEAQASGLPALVSDVGGPREIIRADRTGLVLPAHNPSAWTSAIVALASDHERRAHLAAAAAAHGQTLTIEASFEHFWQLHERAAGWHAPTPSPTIRPPCPRSPSTAACTSSPPAR